MTAEVIDYADYTASEVADVVPQTDQLRSQDRLADTVRDIGSLSCIASKGIIDGNGLHRIRHKALMTVDGYRYVLRVTEPASNLITPNDGLMGMFHGFTQDHDYGGGRSYHNDVASEYPSMRVASVSGNGYNRNGTPLLWREIGTSFNEMAMGRLLLMRQLAQGDKTVLAGLSKGTVLSHLMAELNEELPTPLIDHELSLYHSPAIVPTENVLRDMALKFTGSICVDAAREAVRHPIAALKTMHLPSLRVLPAYVCDVYNLLHGTPEEEVHELVNAGLKIGVVAGNLDHLAQLAMWNRVKQENPNNVEIIVRRGHGHALSMDSRAAAQDIRTVHQKLQSTDGFTS